MPGISDNESTTRQNPIRWLVAFVLVVTLCVYLGVMVNTKPAPIRTYSGGATWHASNEGEDEGRPDPLASQLQSQTQAQTQPVDGQVGQTWPEDPTQPQTQPTAIPQPDLPPQIMPPRPEYKPSTPEAKHVLFVGNSYTFGYDMPNMVKQIAASLPTPVVLDVEMHAPGGALFKDHWISPFYRAILESAPWHYVVLQGNSVEGAVARMRPEFLEYGLKCAGAAKGVGAKVIWFATWARKGGHEFYSDPDEEVGRIPADMLRMLNAGYQALADGCEGSAVARVGNAWAAAILAEASTATPLGIELYESDGSHPSVFGTYLAALVITQTLTGMPATDAGWWPAEITAAQAQALQKAAATVAEK